MRELMLMLHFIGLTMGLGTGFAHAFLGSITGKMTVDEAIKFRLHSLVLSKMGHIGITLLLVSGFYLITPYWKVLSSMSLLIAKLSLVAVLILLISLIGIAAKKAKQGDPEVQLKKMELLGKFTLLVGIAIVILAVKVFR
jgi:uncharacterized membrane protein